MITTASPVALKSPAVMAAWWPKLRDRLTTERSARRLCHSRRIAAVPSVLPSSTMRISTSRSVSASSWAVRAVRNASADSASFHMGETTDSTGRRAASSVTGSPPR